MHFGKALIIALFSIFSFCGYAQVGSINPAYKPLGKNIIQRKNYYLLTLFTELDPVRRLLEADPELGRLAAFKKKALKTSMDSCKDAGCFTEKIKFSDAEIKAIGQRLAAMYAPGNALGKMVDEHLIPSGTYNLYKNVKPAQLLVKAWEQDAKGINYVIGVYAEGKKANYQAIDSISFNVKNPSYLGVLYDCAETVVAETSKTKLFFSPTLTYALQSLEINERHDPANYEPMMTTVNKPAVDRIKQTNFNNYKYTLILVPGAGPDDPVTTITGESMLRCRLAAISYFQHLAPFIMVSGGRAHPYKTRYCEAEEMKKFLMGTLHVPASAILMEPHARHTTTNMRNCARLIFKYGMPTTKACLVNTTKAQNFYILFMSDRCEKELQYVPYRLGERVSATATEFFPLAESLQINSLEPLDP